MKVRPSTVVCAALAAWFAYLLALTARAKPFWHDEIYTLIEAGLPPATLWRALVDGLDLMPPLNALSTRLVHHLVGAGPIASRVPAMAGFLVAIVVLFVMVRRRANARIAVAAVFALYLTATHLYAIEARGYGLTLAFFALALYGWTEAAAGRSPRRHWTIMAAALAAGVWTHYYVALAALPIVCGELVRQAARRRLDKAPWIALAGAALLTVPLVALVTSASQFRPTFWARPRSIDVPHVFRILVGNLDTVRAMLAIVAIAAAIELVRRSRTREWWPRRVPAHEIAAGFVCLALPVLVTVFGYAVHAFDARYAVFTLFGLALAGSVAAWALMPPAGDWLLVAMLAIPMAIIGGRTFRTSEAGPHPFDNRPLLHDWLKGSEPIAIACGVEYLPMWYYAPEASRPRAIALVDPGAQLRATGTDTSDRNYLTAARWTDIPVATVADYTRGRDRFWLYSCGGWVEESLRARRTTFRERGREPDRSGTLYEVVIR